jgi:hypothetical protein
LLIIHGGIFENEIIAKKKKTPSLGNGDMTVRDFKTGTG